MGLGGRTNWRERTGKSLPSGTWVRPPKMFQLDLLDRKAPHLMKRCGAFCQFTVRTPAAFITAKVFSRDVMRHSSVGMA